MVLWDSLQLQQSHTLSYAMFNAHGPIFYHRQNLSENGIVLTNCESDKNITILFDNFCDKKFDRVRQLQSIKILAT